MNPSEWAKAVFLNESESLRIIGENISVDFDFIVDAIVSITGRVMVTGVGKSGIVGKKISASLSSTGTPSYFMHSSEAIHGDLGMIGADDIILAISYSGETEEVLKLIPFFQKRNMPIFSITGNLNSTLANNSKKILYVGIDKEVCPLDLAPTTSATATMVMGDAIVVSLMKKRGFRKEDFAVFHPGGNLGKRLLTKVSDVMLIKDLPMVSDDSCMPEILRSISKYKIGLTVVVSSGVIVGLITDGDIRRNLLDVDGKSLLDFRARDIMSKHPVTIHKNTLLVDAENIMLEKKVNSLIVSNENELVGIIPFKKVF